MSKHTPGPWAIKFRNDHSAYISLGDPVSGPHKQFDVQFTDLYPSDVADASLIASAPDLLAALEDMLNGWKYIRSTHGDLYGVGWDRAQDKAEAAIAKAEGAA
jgi:hypothetical protein